MSCSLKLTDSEAEELEGEIKYIEVLTFLKTIKNYKSSGSDGRKEMFLFNDALNTFYLRLYGVRHRVKDHSDSEKGNPLPPYRLLFPINSNGSFICTIPQTG